MPRPIVQISQTVANITATISDPTQKAVLVGPKYDARVFDPAADDNSSSLVIEDYSPFVGVNLANFTFGTDPEYTVDINGKVDETNHTPKFFVKDASFSVVHEINGAVACVTDNNDGFNTAKAAHHRDLYLDDKGLWSAKKTHGSSPFTVKVGDTIHIGHGIASKFVYSEELAVGDPAKIALGTTNYTIDIAGAGANPVKVLLWDIPNKTVYLHSTEVTGAAADAVASLVVDAGTALTGTLVVPEDQQTTVKSISGNKLTLASVIHSYPLTTDGVKKLSYRIDRKVSEEFTGVTLFEVSSYDVTGDDGTVSTDRTFDFVYDTTAKSQEIHVPNPPDLRDTSIPGIRQIVDSADSLHVITAGEVYSTFRAFDSNGSALIQSINSTNRVSVAGEAHELNPLGLAAQVALSNLGSGSISVLNLPSDNTAGYSSALSILSGDPDVYAMIPLSTDFNNVILEYVNEAERLSDIKQSKFRIVIGASEPCPTKEFLVGSPTNLATGDLFDFDGGTNYVIVDAQAAFITAGVTTSDKIMVAGTEYAVSDVVDENRITVLSQNNAGIVPASGTAIEYAVCRDIASNKERQVQILKSKISSVTSKRLVMVYPGTCTVSGFTDLPGFYLSAAVGGMLSLFEPHRPKNQILLAGIDGISTSNLGYFTADQIDELGDAGYFVLIQNTTDGAPYCVHQVTVAYKDYADTQEFSELSVLNNYDYVSKLLGKSLEPFVGTWNVTPQAISSIRSTLDAALLRLKSEWTDVIGSPVLAYSIKDISVSETSSGTINVAVEVQLPRVLNTIIINIVSV